MKIAFVTTDNREHFKTYDRAEPDIPTPQEALRQGFQTMKDIEVHFVSCAQRPMKSPTKLADNIWFHSLYVPKLGWMRTFYQGCVRAVRLKLKVIRPDIVHGQGTERDCAISAVFSGFPNVVTIHGNMAELARLFGARLGSFHWLAARLENFVLKRTLGVLCNSEYTENLVKPRALHTWRVPNAIRENFFKPVGQAGPPGRCVLANVGVISPRKRQVELLDVARRLHEQGLDFEFHFIGNVNRSEPYSRAFFEQLQPAEESGYARYLGLKGEPELIDCLDRSSALVHFPSEESFGLVVAEALARNLKLFSARVGGITEIAQVPAAELCDVNDFGRLTSVIAAWIRGGSPKPHGQDCIIRSKYHPVVIAQRHLEIYREVLNDPS